MDNMDWGRAQLLLFSVVQREGAINYYHEDGNARGYRSSYQHIHLDREIKGEKEGEQELELSFDKSVYLIGRNCASKHGRHSPLTLCDPAREGTEGSHDTEFLSYSSAPNLNHGC